MRLILLVLFSFTTLFAESFIQNLWSEEAELKRYRPVRKKGQGVRLLMPLTHYGSIDLGYSYEIAVPVSFGRTGNLFGGEVAYEKGIGGNSYAVGFLWLPARDFKHIYKQFSLRLVATQFNEKKDFYKRGGKIYAGVELGFTAAVSLRAGYKRDVDGEHDYFLFAIGAPCILSYILSGWANSSVH